MIRAGRLFLAATTALLLLGTAAQGFASETPPVAPAAAAPPLPTWLCGTWRLKRGERTVTETWLDGGNVLFGVSFSKKGDRVVEFEFLRIERRDGRLAYVAQPGGRPPTVFLLTTSSEIADLRFENPEHDFPQVIRYWLEGDAGLSAEISGPMNGTTESMRFDYRRVAGE